ncbi:MAG: hypothetical protein K2O09_00300, partial [Treponemataceae bacterium]|nr:hypothetical protein [Treponemataceae bacterium]
KTPLRFLIKLCRDGKNFFGWSVLLRWGNSTRLGFWQNRVGRRKPVWVEVAFALGKHHPTAFCLSWRNFRENARCFAHPAKKRPCL